ncbi:MAG: hypothetical protein IH627_06885 [Rubrivivax sp.]|nr:hypothetical protein [Rubrivivax sp.]
MNKSQFVNLTIAIAREHGWRIETNRDGLTQIDFGNKKLHAKHLEDMFPAILADGASVSETIEKNAPGRPCTVRPMRLIITEIKRREFLASATEDARPSNKSKPQHVGLPSAA